MKFNNLKDFLIRKHPFITLTVLILVFAGIDYTAIYQNQKAFSQSLRRATVTMSVSRPDISDKNSKACINLHLVKTDNPHDENVLRGYFNDSKDKFYLVPDTYYYDHVDELDTLINKPIKVDRVATLIEPFAPKLNPNSLF